MGSSKISPVTPGGMLHKIGLKQGDVISRIDSRRVRNIPDFYTYIARAKDKGKIRVEYRAVDTEKFKTVTIQDF